MLGPEDIYGDVRGEVELDDGVLVIKRIHVAYRLRVAEEHRVVAERVLGVHADKCPVARSIAGAIGITTGIEYL